MTELAIRPLQETDIPVIVDYWFLKSDDDLIQIGVDRNKLGAREQFYQSLKDVVHTSPRLAKCFYMIWLIDGKAIGYSSLKDMQWHNIATMHLHVWDTELRGKGYGAKLFCLSAIEYYKLFDLKLILCEPKSDNSMPNKMLTKIGFDKWRTYLARTSDIALLSEFNSYIVDLKKANMYLQVKGELK